MDKVKNKKILEIQGLILKMEQMRGIRFRKGSLGTFCNL